MGDKRRQVGDKCKLTRAEHPERTSCRKTSPETNVKSCGPRMHPFQRSNNPSQVNLFGEKTPKGAAKALASSVFSWLVLLFLVSRRPASTTQSRLQVTSKTRGHKKSSIACKGTKCKLEIKITPILRPRQCCLLQAC